MSYDLNTFHIKNALGEIFSIFTVSSGKDGSLCIHLPYCEEKKGYLYSTKAVYPGPGKTAMVPIASDFVVDGSAKLSIHYSGFVQFSGKNILSGIDSSGNIKGLGLFSNPLDNPVSSGPTAGITCWGIEEGFIQKIKINEGRLNYVINEKDFCFKKREGEMNTYLFEFFIFHPYMKDNLEKRIKIDDNGVGWLTLNFPMYMHPGAIFTFPVLNLKNLRNTIGVLLFKVNTEFAEKIKCGFTVGSPAGSSDKSFKKKSSYRIGCTYPRIFDSQKNLNFIKSK